jgi:hypothetical protein
VLTVQQYRKVGKKRKKLRSWVVVALALILSSLVTLVTYEIIKNTESKKVYELTLNNIVIKEKEMVLKVDTLEYPLSNDIEKLRELSKKFEISHFSIYHGTEPITKASLITPEVVILNGKGEKNLAMNLSVILITNELNVINYGNAKKTSEKSFILIRAPIDDEYTKKLTLLTGISNIVISLNSDVVTPTTAPVIIVLGKDYKYPYLLE